MLNAGFDQMPQRQSSPMPLRESAEGVIDHLGEHELPQIEMVGSKVKVTTHSTRALVPPFVSVSRTPV